jgi:hypothetical protein
MPNNLSTFLAGVSTSPKALRAFEADAQAAVTHAGLSGAAKAAVLSKDPGKIRDAILSERGIQPGVAAAGDIEVVLVVVI